MNGGFSAESIVDRSRSLCLTSLPARRIQGTSRSIIRTVAAGSLSSSGTVGREAPMPLKIRCFFGPRPALHARAYIPSRREINSGRADTHGDQSAAPLAPRSFGNLRAALERLLSCSPKVRSRGDIRMKADLHKKANYY